MDELTFDEMKSILKGLADEAECPICFNPLQPPVSHCSRGHVMCYACRLKLDNCPTCRDTLCESKLKTFNNILQLLPHKCKHSGCQLMVKPGDDHEDWCGHQPTACRLNGCSWKDSGRTLPEHLKQNHNANANIYFVEKIKLISLHWSNGKISDLIFNHMYPTFVFGQFFWLSVENKLKNEVFAVSICLVPNGKLEKSFKICLTLGDDNKRSYSATVKLIPELWLNCSKKVNILILPSSTVQELVSEDNMLPVKYQIEEL